MQRINEEYGHIIENLQKSHFKSTKQLICLGPCDLLYYDEVGWSNINDFLGKLKKTLDIYSMCFVYKEAVIFFCIERNRNKKKNVSFFFGFCFNLKQNKIKCDVSVTYCVCVCD